MNNNYITAKNYSDILLKLYQTEIDIHNKTEIDIHNNEKMNKIYNMILSSQERITSSTLSKYEKNIQILNKVRSALQKMQALNETEFYNKFFSCNIFSRYDLADTISDDNVLSKILEDKYSIQDIKNDMESLTTHLRKLHENSKNQIFEVWNKILSDLNDYLLKKQIEVTAQEIIDLAPHGTLQESTIKNKINKFNRKVSSIIANIDNKPSSKSLQELISAIKDYHSSLKNQKSLVKFFKKTLNSIKNLFRSLSGHEKNYNDLQTVKNDFENFIKNSAVSQNLGLFDHKSSKKTKLPPPGTFNQF